MFNAYKRYKWKKNDFVSSRGIIRSVPGGVPLTNTSKRICHDADPFGVGLPMTVGVERHGERKKKGQGNTMCTTLSAWRNNSAKRKSSVTSLLVGSLLIILLNRWPRKSWVLNIFWVMGNFFEDTHGPSTPSSKKLNISDNFHFYYLINNNNINILI